MTFCCWIGGLVSLDAPVDVFVWLFLLLYGLPWRGWFGGTLLPVEWLSEVLSFVSSAMVEVKKRWCWGYRVHVELRMYFSY